MIRQLLAGLLMTAISAYGASEPTQATDRKPRLERPWLSKASAPQTPAASSAQLSRLIRRTAPAEGLDAAESLSALQAEYRHLKSQGLPIPQVLIDEIFGLKTGPGADLDTGRNGGESWTNAVSIPFAAGGVFMDSGTTIAFVDNLLAAGLAAPALCNTSFFPGFSFGGPDAFYTFTLTESYEVGVSTCGSATYDSCLGIFNSAHELVAVNDDGNGCADFSSRIDPCCLEPGVYYIVVDGYDASTGAYDLTVEFGSLPCATGCADVPCAGTPESEPNNGPVEYGGDDTYGNVSCGETLCGTTWADAGVHDVDWYTLNLTEPGILSLDIEAGFFDPFIAVLDASHAIVASADEFGYCVGESLISNCLPAGAYYVLAGHSGFAGVPDEEEYALTLSCESCGVVDPCESLIPLACGQTLSANSSMSPGNIWESYCGHSDENGPELIFELAHAGGWLTLTLSSDTAEDLDLALLGECDPQSCADMPFTIGPNETLSGEYPAGTWYVIVDAWNYGGTEYNFSLSVECGASPCAGSEPVECTGVAESEPNEGWFADPPNANHGSINCGETVCGSVWALNGARDMDWYRYDHAGGGLLVECRTDAFNALLLLTAFELPEPALPIAASDSAGICMPEALFISSLPAGAYYLVISHNTWEGVPEDQNYALTLTCFADPCEGQEPVDCVGTAEVEPNEGWNATPPNSSHGEIADGETVCGSVWANDNTRDMDWFRFVVTETTNVRLVSEVEAFDCIIYLSDFVRPNPPNALTAVNAGGLCESEELLYECLEPGEYYAAITHTQFNGLPEPQAYSMTLHFEACTPPDPCADLVDAGTLQQLYNVNRPAPSVNHHNASNGCAGGISSAGYDELHLLTLVEETALQIVHAGNGSADEVILVLTDCLHTSTCVGAMDLYGSDPGGETLVITLDTGSYYIVADYWGSGESAPYALSVQNMNVDLAHALPQNFKLLGHAPNPFNPSTTIHWLQPRLLPARLDVYNLTGGLVQSIDLGIRGAGEQHFRWDASGLASGMYVYALSTGVEIRMSKALLVK